MRSYREFVGADGRPWIAWLADPRRHAEEWAALREGDIPEPWLCFSAGRCVHRLRPVPAGWEEMDDQSLVDLWRLAQGAPEAPPSDAEPRRRRWDA
jgi:hypothetical protein